MNSLQALQGKSVSVSDAGLYPEPGAVLISFSEGSRLRADFWRVKTNGRVHISNFDHDQKYGLPAPINAIAELQKDLGGKTVQDARLDSETGDLLFKFSGGVELQVLNLTSYEVWEIHFSNGATEYSNYHK